LTQRQPGGAIIRFLGERAFELDESLVAAAEFLQARSEVEPGPNGLRIERKDVLKGRDRLLVSLFLCHQNAVMQPALFVAGRQVKRTLSRGNRSGIIPLRL